MWNNRLFFQTQDRDFVFHVGGAVHSDGAWYHVPDSLEHFPGGTGPFDDGVNQRRGRLRADGPLDKTVALATARRRAGGRGNWPCGTATPT